MSTSLIEPPPPNSSPNSPCRICPSQSESMNTKLCALTQQRLEFSPRSGYIRIKIQYGATYQLFDMKKDKCFSAALRRFAKKINHEPAFLRFHSAGIRVLDTDTPSSLDMDELDTLGNIVEAHLLQTGG